MQNKQNLKAGEWRANTLMHKGMFEISIVRSSFSDGQKCFGAHGVQKLPLAMTSCLRGRCPLSVEFRQRFERIAIDLAHSLNDLEKTEQPEEEVLAENTPESAELPNEERTEACDSVPGAGIEL